VPSCTGGAAQFGDKPTGVDGCGPLKLETFLYCNELSGYPCRKSNPNILNPTFSNKIPPAGRTGGCEVEELSRASNNSKFGGYAGRLNVLNFLN